MGYQFAHIETYSRSGGRNGSYAVRDILAEARRSPESCLHVATPLPPVLVAGSGLEDLEQRHEAVVGAARETLANGKERAIRKDTCSLYTAVLSHPATPDECRVDPATMAAVKAWARDSAAWLRRDLESRGGTLETVIMHVDESHVHLHAYGLHPSGHADRMHPGKVAKRNAVTAAVDRGHDKKTANAVGDKAYVEAMRQWQDSYSREVGLLHGLTRLGPARRRLTRAEWQAEQAVAKSVGDARRLAKGAMDDAKTAKHVRDRILDEAQQKARLLALESHRRVKGAKATEDAAANVQRKAESLVRDAEQERDRILSHALRDLSRLRSVGASFRAFWDSLRISAIRRRVRQEVQGQIDREVARAAAAQRLVQDEARRRREAEARLADAIRSAHSLGRERDDLRRERDLRLGQAEVKPPHGLSRHP